jgi:hypothetical protein
MKNLKLNSISRRSVFLIDWLSAATLVFGQTAGFRDAWRD